MKIPKKMLNLYVFEKLYFLSIMRTKVNLNKLCHSAVYTSIYLSNLYLLFTHNFLYFDRKTHHNHLNFNIDAESLENHFPKYGYDLSPYFADFPNFGYFNHDSEKPNTPPILGF